MKVSIIIPAFNAESFIGRCLDSVYCNAPSEGLFEVIIINDGSVDNTVTVIKEYASHHSNLTLIDKKNEGVSVARNIGIDTAQGEFVMFVDADDELIGGALKKVLDYLSEHEPMDMLVTRQIRRNKTREWIVNAPNLEEHRSYTGIDAYRCHYVRMNAGGGICRTEFLRHHGLRFPVGVSNSEDTIFFGLLQVYAQSIVYYDLPLYTIDMTGSSASRIDSTRKGLNYAITMKSVIEIKERIQSQSLERRAIFDFVAYQMLSNMTAQFVVSKDLGYHQLCSMVALEKILPFDTKNMQMKCWQAQIINTCFPLFYFLNWIKRQFGR
jgi:glycosyltransferase involved in cell wall biosynthesis